MPPTRKPPGPGAHCNPTTAMLRRATSMAQNRFGIGNAEKRPGKASTPKAITLPKIWEKRS